MLRCSPYLRTLLGLPKLTGPLPLPSRGEAVADRVGARANDESGGAAIRSWRRGAPGGMAIDTTGVRRSRPQRSELRSSHLRAGAPLVRNQYGAALGRPEPPMGRARA